jgi:hypothetical protein
MSIYGANNVFVGTTGSASVDTVVMSSPGYSVKVTNVSGTSPLFWTVDSPGGACFAPTVGGHNAFCSASVAGTAVNSREGDFQFGAIVQLISTAPTQYMVEVQSARATS